MIRWRHMTAAWRNMDWLFVASVAVLMVIGILFIYSASSRSEDAPIAIMAERQLVWALVGIGCFLGLVALDYHRVGEVSWWLYAGCLILLALVLIMGKKVYGAYRWLNLFGIQVQPAEFAKLGTMLALARFLSQPSRDVTGFRSLIEVLIAIGVPMALIMRQPDLGTASTLIPVSFALMFVSGVPRKYLLALMAIGLLSLPVAWEFMADYQHDRVITFFHPERDPLGSGWNKIQSEIAVGSGGVTGKGYLMGTQNILGFLPRTVAPTDFIFSVIAEEMGFVGSGLLLVLYALVIAGGLRAALRARDALGRLMAVGVITLLFWHVFVNMAMTIGLMPVTGIPLPLISYGGSFMVCTMAGLGIVQSVYARRIRR